MELLGERLEVKVLDGGLGTELARSGYADIEVDPLWSARILKENPCAIKEIHKNFLKAGSDAIISSTYQASVDGFMKHCSVSREEARRLIALGVDVARDAVKEVEEQDRSGGNRRKYVAASVGPYGACLSDGSEYFGNYVDDMSIGELKDWHRERLSIVASREPDFLAIETIPAKKEAAAVVELLREFPNSKAWVTFSCKCRTGNIPAMVTCFERLPRWSLEVHKSLRLASTVVVQIM